MATFSQIHRIFPEKTFDLSEIFGIQCEYQGACQVAVKCDDTAIETLTFNDSTAANNFVTEEKLLAAQPVYGRIITLTATDNSGAAGSVRKMDIVRRNVLAGSDSRKNTFARLLPSEDFGKPNMGKEFWKAVFNYKTASAKTLAVDVYINRSASSSQSITLPASTTETRYEVALTPGAGAPLVGYNIAFKLAATGTNQGWIYSVEPEWVPLMAGGG